MSLALSLLLLCSSLITLVALAGVAVVTGGTYLYSSCLQKIWCLLTFLHIKETNKAFAQHTSSSQTHGCTPTRNKAYSSFLLYSSDTLSFASATMMSTIECVASFFSVRLITKSRWYKASLPEKWLFFLIECTIQV